MAKTATASQHTPSLNYTDMANALRFLAIDAVNAANSGHPGMPMGLADVATVLFAKHMRFHPQRPKWPNRDRFVLSNGHGSMLQYGLLHLLGYDLPLTELKNFRQLHSHTPGHPEYGETIGVETTTGPLGQGMATAVGMALGQKLMAARFGDDIFNNKTYVIVGDGCLMEGISHEAAEMAARWNLSNLIVLFDDNGITIDGKTDLAVSTNHIKRFESYGFTTRRCDGHDFDDIDTALSWARKQDKPVFIACRTRIGQGSPNMADSAKVHGSPLGEAEAEATRKALGWTHAPFDIPQSIRADWKEAAEHGKRDCAAWDDAFQALPADKRKAIENGLDLKIDDAVFKALHAIERKAVSEKPSVATRKASGNCLDVITPLMPTLVSGSADLTGSNNTWTPSSTSLTPKNFAANYIHYGVREHAMAAVMNGISLYGGLRPISGTFLAFLDYMRPAVRLAALMKLPVVHVLTHDSIGLGEDGPTHQPVEHLATLRAMPNMTSFRPADQIETAECWEAALRNTTGPSALILSRQNLPTVREMYSEEVPCSRGGYVLRHCDGKADGIFIASGSEVHIAVKAYELLKAKGIDIRVVSMPSMELFLRQDKAYRDSVLPANITARVGIEAASPFGWAEVLGSQGVFIGMRGFGASAPADELYKHFGITAEDACRAMEKLIK